MNLLLLLCCLGVLSRGGTLAWQRYTLYRSERVARTFLERVWERQQAFRKTTDRYAGTLEALSMRPPAGAALRVVAINRLERQSFWVELCSPTGCLSLDESGEIRTAVSLLLQTGPQDAGGAPTASANSGAAERTAPPRETGAPSSRVVVP